MLYANLEVQDCIASFQYSFDGQTQDPVLHIRPMEESQSLFEVQTPPAEVY